MVRKFGLCVLLALLALPYQVCAGAFPWRAGDAPPVLAGLTLGDSREKVETLLGVPDVVEPVGAGFKLSFKSPEIAVLIMDGHGVGVIILNSASAGDVDGIHVGIKCTDVVAKWGNPDEVHGTQALYKAGAWGVVIDRDASDQITFMALTNILPHN